MTEGEGGGTGFGISLPLFQVGDRHLVLILRSPAFIPAPTCRPYPLPPVPPTSPPPPCLPALPHTFLHTHAHPLHHCHTACCHTCLPCLYTCPTRCAPPRQHTTAPFFPTLPRTARTACHTFCRARSALARAAARFTARRTLLPCRTFLLWRRACHQLRDMAAAHCLLHFCAHTMHALFVVCGSCCFQTTCTTTAIPCTPPPACFSWRSLCNILGSGQDRRTDRRTDRGRTIQPTQAYGICLHGSELSLTHDRTEKTEKGQEEQGTGTIILYQTDNRRQTICICRTLSGWFSCWAAPSVATGGIIQIPLHAHATRTHTHT